MKLSALIVIVLMAFMNQAFALSTNWLNDKFKDAKTAKLSCVLKSQKVLIHDGYGDSSIQLIVYKDRLEIKTESNIDHLKPDVGLEIDQQPLIAIDEVKSETTGLFVESFPRVVEQFKAGSKARLSMRFWPTWPETVLVKAEFSLVGFSTAFNRCWPN